MTEDAGPAKGRGTSSAVLLVAPALLTATLGANYEGLLGDAPAALLSLLIVGGALLLGVRIGWLERQVTSRVVRLGIPVVLGMFTQAAVNVGDMYFVGRLPADVALPGVAAIGISLPVFWLVGGFLSAIAIGTQAITARRRGQNNDHDAGKTLMTAVAIALGSGIVFSAAGYLVLPYVLPFFNADPHVVLQSTTFASIRYIGITSMVVTSAYKAFFDGTGKTYVHLVAAIAMNAVNLVLCWLLIPGNAGFPRLEVAGAAWSSVISSVVGTLIMVLWSFRGEARRRYGLYRRGCLDWATGGAIVRLSLPSGAATVIGMIGFLFFHRAIGRVDAIESQIVPVNASAAAVIQQIVMLAFMIAFAFGTATATLVSMSMGAKDIPLAIRYGWDSVKIGIIAMAGVGAMLFIFPDDALSFFLKAEQLGGEAGKALAIDVGVPALRLIAVASTLVAAAVILTQSLYGAGNTKFVMLVEGVLHLSCLVPLSWVLGVTLGGGLLGVWSAAAIYALLLAGIMGWKFWGGSWHNIEL